MYFEIALAALSGICGNEVINWWQRFLDSLGKRPVPVPLPPKPDPRQFLINGLRDALISAALGAVTYAVMGSNFTGGGMAGIITIGLLGGVAGVALIGRTIDVVTVKGEA